MTGRLPALRFLTVAFLLALVPLSSRAAIVLSGEVSGDFANAANCFDDGRTASVAGTGFDIDRVCFHYDRPEDRLTIGVEAVDGAVIGDADGDGDPSVSSTPGEPDADDLGGSETFVISIDLDGDSAGGDFDASTVDILIGVSNTGTLAQLGVYRPDGDYQAVSPGGGFGAETNHTVSLFAAPSADFPDLEFIVEDFFLFSPLQDGLSPAPVIQVFTEVSGLESGRDFLPSPDLGLGLGLDYPLYDGDGDDLEDWEELDLGTSVTSADTDADGIMDGVEVNGTNPTDPLDNDSDDDGLLDGEEDANGDGTVGVEETDPAASDTDAGGVNDGVEMENGLDPLDPTDDSQAGTAVGQTGAPAAAYDSLMGGGVGCGLNRSKTLSDPVCFSPALLGLTLLLLWRVRRRVS